MPFTTTKPVGQFTDINGKPLDGQVFFGQPNLDPIANPITVYWDAAGTQPVTQPVVTVGGYPMNGSTRSNVFVNADYSILVRNRNGFTVFSAPNLPFEDSSDNQYFLQAGSGAVQRTVQSKLRDVVSVKDFGAVGDGVTDDTAAIQAALSSGAKRVIGVAGDNYKITAPLRIASSNMSFDGSGATITQATTNESALVIGYNGSSFVQVSDVTVSDFAFVGSDNGLTSTVSYAVSVYNTSSVPYTNSNGCQRITIEKCRFSAWAVGVAGTGVNGLLVKDNFFTGMKYHASVFAGGYGVLAQTCFDVKVSGNRFVAQNGDRHAIYISSDPSRSLDSNNVCKQVLIDANLVDWSGVVAISGFETCVAVRGAFDIAISGNVFKGGYGCIDYNLENAAGENISVTGNIFDGVLTQGTSTRAAVGFLRSSGSYKASNVTVTGNTIKLSGAYAIGVQMAYLDNGVVEGNSITAPNNPNSLGVLCVETSRVMIGGNTIHMGNGYAAVSFSGTNSKITVNENRIDGASYLKFYYQTVPTELKFGYKRTCYVESNGSGTVSVYNADATDPIVSAGVSEPAGVKLQFLSHINPSFFNTAFLAANQSIGAMFHRDQPAPNDVSIGVTNHSGGYLAAATNAYAIAVHILS